MKRPKIEDSLKGYKLKEVHKLYKHIVKLDQYIDHIEDKIEELELKLKIQKMHCKMFHRQKFTIWFESQWWRLISFLKKLIN